MHPSLEYIREDGLRTFAEENNLTLADNIEELRDHQYEALDWALSQRVPYLLLNAPTGSGKTLINAVYSTIMRDQWTYGVHTVMLQKQVGETLPDVPVLTGRSWHPCLVGMDTYGYDVNADRGVCTLGEWCAHTGRASDDGEPASFMCSYYQQMADAMLAGNRITNYSMMLNLPTLRQRGRSATLLADEAHNVEEIVCNNAGFKLSLASLRRYRVELPSFGPDLGAWCQWASKVLQTLPQPRFEKGVRPDFGLKTLHDYLGRLSNFNESDLGNWIVYEEHGDYSGTHFEPVWGREFVMPQLFGHQRHDIEDIMAGRQQTQVKRVLFTSATLMGAEYIADTLGLPDGSWAYLDLDSTFPAENRPINYAPITPMNQEKMATPEGRKPMQDAIDRLVEYYVLNNAAAGVVHAVSNKYRDQILTESRWRAIMTTDVQAHATAVRDGRASVLVAANVTEGWDGYDELCRFVLFPKVPFPNLGDKRTAVRRAEDPRSYDHRTLVAIVQGAGRGVRHREDKADTWILDSNWRIPFNKHRDWLPSSFLDAYHGPVTLI